MGKSFAETMAGQTLNIDLSKALDGTRDMVSLSTDLFLIAIRMREAEELGDPEALRKLIVYYLDLFRKNCKAAGIGEDSVSDALYAIVALIDETVLSNPGECRDFWFGRSIQLDLFGDNIAGEEFFRRLQKLLEQPEKKKDALEVYYLCLSLGFEGKYKIYNPEELQTIIEETGRKLRKARIKTASGISPHGGNRKEYYVAGTHGKSIGFPIWAGAIAAICVCVGTYLVLLGLTMGDLEKVMRVVGGVGAR
jgi:type VI secretion system protein ImpK